MSFYSLNFFSWCNFYNLFFILKKYQSCPKMTCYLLLIRESLKINFLLIDNCI